MSTSRQRWTLAGTFLGVGLVGWLGAMGTTRVAAGFLALPKGAAVVTVTPIDGPAPEPGVGPGERVGEGDAGEGGQIRPSRRPNRRASEKDYVDPIVKRSLFDSSRIGQEPTETAEVTGEERRSDLKVILMATIVAIPAEYSSALITEDRDSGAQGFGIGDKLLGEAEIIAIEPRKVVVRRSDGAVEYIEMGGDVADLRERPEPGDKEGEAEELSGVSGGNGKYVVEQEVLDKILENPEQLYSQVRVVPHKDQNGEIDGYRMSGIRRQSLFYQLGVKNGDIVHAVNGKPLTSMNAAMDAYNSLQSSRNFTFEITRRNQKQTFEYEVR